MNTPAELSGHSCKSLYLYIAKRQSGNLGYYDMSYYDMARCVGLLWTPEHMAGTVCVLRRALERLIRCKLICVKPGEQPGVVRLRLRVNPRRAAKERGPWWLDDLLPDLASVDPWAVIAKNG